MYFYFIAKKTKKMSLRRILHQTRDDESVDIIEICNDNESDNRSEVCIICDEYGNDEVWCTNCGLCRM